MSTHTESHAGLFIKVWVVLLVLTLVEILLAYVQLGHVAMITLLMGLSLVKTALIMAYFMHLKFDSKLFSGLFVGGILLTSGILLALLALFDVFVS